MTRAPLRLAVAALALAAALLSGCGQPAEDPFDVEVRSGAEEALAGPAAGDGDGDVATTQAAAAQPGGEGRGHLAGVVVDEAIRPIRNATVRLPGPGLTARTGRDGSFGFVDLMVAPYRMEVNATGYRDAATIVQVDDGEFTRAKVILSAIPAPKPYHLVLEFQGFAELSGNPLVASPFACDTCRFEFGVERDGLRAMVLEATFDAPPAGNERGFYVRFGGTTVLCIICSGEPDPMRLELRDDDLPEGSRFILSAEPQTFPAYETSVRFHVYATAFYNGLPPTGWSFVAGDR
ncbi:MAG: Carboxypeptidase regulatory-like domain [Thermoplasmata archaeon]|nr:Carboxypeptidase regulatory-like domain [Thermoplasmata archaeon]